MHQLLLKGIKGSSSQRRTKEQSAWSLRVLLEPGGRAKLQLRGAVGDVGTPKPPVLTTPHVPSLVRDAWSHVAVVVSSDGDATIFVNGRCESGPSPWHAGMPNGGPLVVTPRTDAYRPDWALGIAELRLWSEARSEAQVRRSTCADLPLLSPAAHVDTLAGDWTLDGADEAAAHVIDRSCSGSARRHGQVCVDSKRLDAMAAVSPLLQLPKLLLPHAADLPPHLSANDAKGLLERLHQTEHASEDAISASAALRTALGLEANLALLRSPDLCSTSVCTLGGALLRERDLVTVDDGFAANCAAVLQALLQDPAVVMNWARSCQDLDPERELAIEALTAIGLAATTPWPTNFEQTVLNALHALPTTGAAGDQCWGAVLRHMLTAGKPFALDQLRWLLGTSPLRPADVVSAQAPMEARQGPSASVEYGERDDGSTAMQCHLGIAAVGQPVWSDWFAYGVGGKRPTIASLSDGLAGGILVHGASKNKWSDTEHLQLRLQHPCNVYVCFDSRAGGAWVSGATRSLPKWLASWSPSAEIISLCADRTHGWTVYEKRYDAGVVALGGNLDGIAGQTYDQYFVIVRMIADEVKTVSQCKCDTSWLQTCHWKMLTDAVCSGASASTLQATQVLRVLFEVSQNQVSFGQHSLLLEGLLRYRNELQARAAAARGGELEMVLEQHVVLTAALTLLADNVSCFATHMLDFYIEVARSASRPLQQVACKGLHYISCDSSGLQRIAAICSSPPTFAIAAIAEQAADDHGDTRHIIQERLLSAGGLGALSSLISIRAPDQLEIQCVALDATRSLLREHASYDAAQSLQLLASIVKIICTTPPDGALRTSGTFSTREMMRRAAEMMRRGVVPTGQTTKKLRAQQKEFLLQAAADVVEALGSDKRIQEQLSHLQCEGKGIDSTQLIDALTTNMHALDSAFGRSLIHLCRASVPLAEELTAELAARALVLGEELVFGVKSVHSSDEDAVWRPSFTPQQQLSLSIEYLSAVSAVSPASRLQITPKLEPMWTCCGQLMAILDRQVASNRSIDKAAASERLFPVLDILRRAELIDAERALDEGSGEPEPELASDGSSAVVDVLLPSLLCPEESGGSDEEPPGFEGPELDLPQLQVPHGCVGPKMIAFLETHRTALNYIVANDIEMLWDQNHGPADTMEGSAGGTRPTWLRCRVVFQLFDFITKAHFLRAWLKRHKQALLELDSGSATDTKVVVQRDNLFEDAYCKVGQGLSAADLRNNLVFKFDGEEGEDVGGLTREWFELISREIFNPDYALFSLGADAAYQPSSASAINHDHLSYFRFVGRVIGLAIYHSQLMGVHFTRSVYKHMLGLPISLSDLESVDPQLASSLQSVIDTEHADMLCLSFLVPSASAQYFGGHGRADDDGEGVTEADAVELVEGGADIEVDDSNKREYVARVAHHCMTAEIAPQLRQLVAGLHEVVPRAVLQLFDPSELELLISGMPEIDIDDWAAHTVLQPGGFADDSPQVVWFWRAVEAMTAEERCRLLQFCTGSSRVPLAGFAALRGAHGDVMRFTIAREASSGGGAASRLPTAHTCFNQLVLPEYRSYEELAHRLGQAIAEGAEGFGFV